MREYPEAAVERAMKVQEVILRAMAKRITWWQAAEILGITERSMRRWRARMERYGDKSLVDRRRGKPSPKRVPVATIEKVLELYRDKYFDFNVKHFHQKLESEHGIQLSYTWVKQTLQGAGLVKKAPKRGCHRRRRPRRPLPGMLLHLDGSHHQWFQDDRWHDLIVVLDDATSEIYYAQLVDDESTKTVMAALKQVVEDQGWFCALYSDRAGHFFVTPKAGEAVDRRQLTQVGRALRDLDIQMIPAYSPQARGRSERSFRTWQGRLPQELRIRGIRTVAEANHFLRHQYIAEFNTRFKVPPAESGTAFVPNVRRDLDRIFAVHHERVVNHDNTITYGQAVLQLEPVRWRATLAGCRVMVYEHLDGSLSVGYGPHEIGRFQNRIPGPKSRRPARAVKVSHRGEKKESAIEGRGRFFLNKVTSATRSSPR
jgi:transposase/broad specificity phosphatase PhoE